MKIHRFYIPQQKTEGETLSTDQSIMIHFLEAIHQMKNVLRLQIGEKVIFFNGDGNEYLSCIHAFEGKDKVTLTIEKVTKNPISFEKEIHLFFSLIKKDNIEWILEKGTELGVTHFVPIISARSEKKDINIERAHKIIIEATEQCGRNTPPVLHEIYKLEDVFNNFDLSFIVLEKNFPVLNGENIKDTSIGLLIGPEGGWTPEELEMFTKKKATFRSLSPAVLRAETAAIVAVSRFV